jgi:ATP-dependent DNA helicase RecG
MEDDRGRKERKCYLRHGSSDYESTEDELRDLYRKGNPIPYEMRTARHQELTFEALSRFFESSGIDFSESKFPILGIQNETGFFTNLGFWVSDQSTVETRLGFFSGTNKGSPVNGLQTFMGCIIEQYDKIRRTLYNRFGYSYEIPAFTLNRDGTRNEVREYPEAAVREALINMFAHRDYSLENTQAFVSCFTDHLEMLSFGGLPAGVDEYQLKEGISIPRNRRLAELLMRLSAMEKYGLGIPLMYSSYEPFGLEPKIIVEAKMLKIILPKITLNYSGLSERQQSIVHFLRKNGASTRAAIQAHLGKSYGTTMSELRPLLARGILEKTGGGKETQYKIK